MKRSAKRLAILSALTALSLICFMLESLLPPIIIPGAKLGLANIFVLLALIYLSPTEALILVVVKCFMGAIFSGFSMLMYSLPSSLISFLTSALLIRFFIGRFSLTAIGAFSAVIHNLTQNAVFALATSSVGVLIYAPYLALIGVACGIFTGYTAYFISKRLNNFILKTLSV